MNGPLAIRTLGSCLLAAVLASCASEAAPEVSSEVSPKGGEAAPGPSSRAAVEPLQQSEVGYYQEVSWAPDGASLLVSVLEMADTPDGFIYRVHRLYLDPLSVGPVTSGPMDYWTAWSPDGVRFAFASRSGENTDIYVMDADGSGEVRLTEDAALDTQPAWSPDGSRIAFVSERTGSAQLFLMNADGSEQSRIVAAEGEAQSPSWSPDGSRIAYFETAADGADSIYVMKADGTGREQLAPGVFPSWSVDGSRILYGAPDGLAIMSADGGNQELIVEGDIDYGVFSPDGSEIAFVAGEGDRIAIRLMDADGSEQRTLMSRPAPPW